MQFFTLKFVYSASIFAQLLFHEVHADDIPRGNTSVFVRYSNANKNTELNKSPYVKVSFDDDERQIPFTMDTGSVGIVVSAELFHPGPNSRNLGPGRQVYSSSGVIEEGTWWTATQNIHDSDGKILFTAEVPVLRVTSVKCTEDARQCHPHEHPKHIAMMGIGFGREGDKPSHKTPNYNPFLNGIRVLREGTLKPLPRDWCNGYVITATGVHIGLTPTNTANAGFVKLEPWEEYSVGGLTEWRPTPMTIQVNGTSGPGHLLMDTGVGTAYLTPPHHTDIGRLVSCPNSSRKECFPDGDVIKVFIPNETKPVAYYTFTVGQRHNPMEPKGVHHVRSSKTFLNTSRHFLAGMNYIYDNSNGYVGFIWNGQTSDEYGYVRPNAISR